MYQRFRAYFTWLQLRLHYPNECDRSETGIESEQAIAAIGTMRAAHSYSGSPQLITIFITLETLVTFEMGFPEG